MIFLEWPLSDRYLIDLIRKRKIIVYWKLRHYLRLKFPVYSLSVCWVGSFWLVFLLFVLIGLLLLGLCNSFGLGLRLYYLFAGKVFCLNLIVLGWWRILFCAFLRIFGYLFTRFLEWKLGRGKNNIRFCEWILGIFNLVNSVRNLWYSIIILINNI